MSVEIGEIVPQFTCVADDGQRRDFSVPRGRWLVLFFYPKASTPGCTTESKDFTALHEAFAELDCDVWGCSTDSVRRQANFRDKQGLTIPLLADEERQVHDIFGAWAEKKNYGRVYMGTVRSTYLIDPEGKLVEAWPKVRVKGHAEAVLEALKAKQA